MKAVASLAALLLLLASCVHRSASEEQADQYPWVLMPMRYAKCFTVEERKADRRITVFGSGGRSDTIAVYTIHGDSLQGRAMPLQRLAVVSTTHLAYLAALECLDRVVGAAHLERIAGSSLRAHMSEEVMDIGTADGLDREKLIALKPNALLDYPFGRTSSTGVQGLQRIEITEYLEDDPLGRAEWLRFFGVILGREAFADSLFGGIAARYEEARGLQFHPRPKVFFGSAWQGQWFVPPAHSYMGTLIRDAGAELAYTSPGSNENVALDLESVLQACAKADHFGIVLAYAGVPNAEALSGGDARLATMKAIREGGFYGNSSTSDLFGTALLEPEVVLRDLVCIFHPAQCSGHHARYFAPLVQ